MNNIKGESIEFLPFLSAGASLTLMNDTGRILHDDKRSDINAKSANILTSLHISDESCLKLTPYFEDVFYRAFIIA